MSTERRMDAAELFWGDEQSTDQQVEAITAIASHMKFRTKSVLALPAEKRVRYLATLPTISDTIAARALVNYHLERQRPMMAAFLDLLGISHENGLINDEDGAKPERGRSCGRPRPSWPRSSRRRTSRCISRRSCRRIPTHGAIWLSCPRPGSPASR